MADRGGNGKVQVDTNEARAGSTPGVVRYILVASMVLVIVGFVAVYLLH